MMRNAAAIILVICMAVTGTCLGIPEKVVTGEDITASAASYPALKTISYEATGDQRKDVVGFAKSQLGYTEGSNNNTYFGNWFGCNYNPWCAMFVCWCAAKAGVSSSVVPRLAMADRSWAKEQGVYYKSRYWGGTYTPQGGDLIYFSWSVRDYADHIGMVTGTHKENGVLYVDTIEGNKHDKVTTGSYEIGNRYVLGYVSPKYKSAEKYTLKYRDGIGSTSVKDDEAKIKPVTGTVGEKLELSDKKYEREGYHYTEWRIYRISKNKHLYLCHEKGKKTVDKWYSRSKMPADFEQVRVTCGGKVKLHAKPKSTVYAKPAWELNRYDVTYDANGGMNAPSKQEKIHGKDLTLSTEKPTKENAEFLGWATSRSADEPKYKGGETYQKNEAVTLYAIWGIDPYKVRTTAKVSVRTGAGKNFKKVGSIESGKKVTIVQERDGWGKKTDGNWINLKFTRKLNVTRYNLIYDDGNKETTDDSSVVAPTTGDYGSAATLSSKKFNREGHHYSKMKVYYLLNGHKVYLVTGKKSGKEKWLEEKEINDDFQRVYAEPGKELTVKKSIGENIYVTPIWKIDKYTITYSANGGKNAPKAQTKTYNKKLKLSTKKPTRKWGKFLGWSTSKTATKAKYKPGSKFTKNKSVKLYAVWKMSTFKVKTIDEVNKRTGPGLNYEVVGVIDKGKIVTIVKKKDGWGKLKSGRWIHLSLTRELTSSGKGAGHPADADDSGGSVNDEDPPSDEEVNDDSSGDQDENNSSEEGTSENTSENDEDADDSDEDSDDSDSSKKSDQSEDADDSDDSDSSDEDKEDEADENTFTVEVTAEKGVNVRTGSSKSHDVTETRDPGDTMEIAEVSDGWGRLSGTEHWILLKNTRIKDGYKVKITSEDLFQRSGPGSGYDIEGFIDPGTYEIEKINGDWGKVKSTGNWVKLEYAKRVTETE